MTRFPFCGLRAVLKSVRYQRSSASALLRHENRHVPSLLPKLMKVTANDIKKVADGDSKINISNPCDWTLQDTELLIESAIKQRNIKAIIHILNQTNLENHNRIQKPGVVDTIKLSSSISRAITKVVTSGSTSVRARCLMLAD